MRLASRLASRGTSGLLVIVLAVIIAIGATGYLLTSNLSGVQRPVIVLAPANANGTQMTVSVTEASPEYSLAEFRALLQVDNATEGDLDPLVDGGIAGALSFSDMDGDGTLSAGDRFVSDSQSVGDFVLQVLWQSEQVGLRGWRQATTAGLGPETRTGNGYVVEVDAASPQRPLSEFSAWLSRDYANLGRLASLSDGARAGNLTFSDVDGNGLLTLGDRVVIDTADPGAYSVGLAWRSAEVAKREWSVPLPPGGLTVTICCAGGSFMTAPGVTVASADPTRPLSEFRAILLKNGTVFNEINPLSQTPPPQYLRFRDVDYDGQLSAGDRFSFECSPEQQMNGCTFILPRNSVYVFRLYWGDVLVVSHSFGG